MGEDGEQDAVHGCLVLEGPHGSGPSPHFAESSFDSICGPYLAALVLRFVAEAGEEFVEVVAQTCDRVWIFELEAVGEAPCGSAGGRSVGRIHDLVDGTLGGRLVSLFDLVEDVADLMRPAALDGNARQDRGQGGQEAGPAIDADHIETLAGKAAAEQIGEEALPFGRALARRQTKVDDLLPAVRAQAEGDENRPA